MVFHDRLKNLLGERQINWADLSKSLGIGRNQLRYWEDHNSLPDGKTLIKLADYFGVTSDYLLGIDALKEKSLIVLSDPDLTLTAEEKWFILKLRRLDKEGKTMVESTLIAESRRVDSKSDTYVG